MSTDATATKGIKADDNGTGFRLIPTLGIVALGLFAYWAAAKNFAGMTIGQIAPLELASVFGFLLLITICTERAVEVVINVVFGPAFFRISQPVKEVVAEELIKKEKMEIGLSMMDTPAERVAFIASNGSNDAMVLPESSRQVISNASTSLSELSQRKLPIAVLTASLFGLLLSISGVQLLAALAHASAVTLPTEESQGLLFRFADILVTTFVIAGGADGVHQVLKRYLGTATDIESLLKPLKS